MYMLVQVDWGHIIITNYLLAYLHEQVKITAN